MNMVDKIRDLSNKDNSIAYQALLQLERWAAETPEIVRYFDEFLTMIKSEKSFIRVRGFRLICCLAKWDKAGLINKNIDTILLALNDANGTSVRQCLISLSEIMLYKTELHEVIADKLKNLDLTQHKASMQLLISSDISALLARL